jgi:SAM-dependent methyltransferase
MSSPIASSKKNVLRKYLIGMHQKLSHNHRIHILARRIAAIIAQTISTPESIRCLDIGCGDMKISEFIQELDPRTVWNCIDLYDLPEELKKSDKWSRYQKYDGRHIPFGDKSIDIVMLCDVLHHAGGDAAGLLREASRVGRTIIVKDHFEYSLYSHTVLKALDFLGNWGYGVALPERYFSRNNFEKLCLSSGLKVRNIEVGVDLYSHLLVMKYLLKSKWHFIAILESCERTIKT